MSVNENVFVATEANFETDVIRASSQTPILIDFWAEWCGPCKTLGPILDKLAEEFNGALKIAKIDVEASQQLAGMFQIQSIPTVILVHNGQLVDGFQGALPASQIKEFLAKHNIVPAEAAAEPEPEVDTRSNTQIIAELRDELAKEGASDELKLDLAIALLNDGETVEAKNIIDHLPANLATDARAQRAQSHLNLLAYGANAEPVSGESDQMHRDGVAMILKGDIENGLQKLLDLMAKDRKFGDDLARKTLIDAFRLAEDPAIVAQYRRKLSALVF